MRSTCIPALTRITPACAGKSKTRRVQWPVGLDHPRVCGEKRPDRQLTGWPLGSPPRVRGKVDCSAQLWPLYGITPAYAGKSPDAACFSVTGSGSPPRMRGKVNSPPQRLIKFGITPAYAGKSYTLLDLPAGERDHPRVCGEKALGHGHQPFVQGSPPRMRGKVYKAGVQDAGRGITPAYAGKRLRPSRPRRGCWDHPRVCGEKAYGNNYHLPDQGSPPRMRGKGNRRILERQAQGITPAYAGKSHSNISYSDVFGDHPRVCGEKAPDAALQRRVVGSPPRMRGKGLFAVKARDAVGITPAYAGKRAPFQKKSTPGRDHPRVCGEKLGLAQIPGSVLGSPPRMRGKGSAPPRGHPLPGITPAYAGKSWWRTIT